MKFNKLRNFIVAVCVLFVGATSCNDWLAVDLEDSILEDKLFSTNEGYTSVLNGVYTKMNTYYGSTLSMGTVDVMAKLYHMTTNHNLSPYFNYKFQDEAFENTSGALWTGLYNLIANLNTLIEYCDSENSALKEHFKPYVKGEALALRAMFHFDLLRLYGPIYSDATKSTITIPYQATTDKTIQPLLSAEQIIDKVLGDLKAASTLLANDVVRTDGVLNSDSEDPNETSDFRYRQYRLNYYAIQGLMARAYLWKGDKENAYITAKAIIDEVSEKKTFDWTPKASVQSTSAPDLIFSTEVMFGLYNLKRVNLYNSYFKSTTSYTNALYFYGKNVEEGNKNSKINWFYTDLTDLRRTEMWEVGQIEENSEYGGTNTYDVILFNKYQDIQTSESRRYMIPLLRISEIYLIAAECSTDLTEAMGYVNAIRANRNCIDLDSATITTLDDLKSYIDAEFYRETIGEGQIYFHYKRNAMTSILESDMSYGSYGSYYAYITMDLANYVWPLPHVETDKRMN